MASFLKIKRIDGLNKIKCSSFTSKKRACKNFAIPNSQYCKVHNETSIGSPSGVGSANFSKNKPGGCNTTKNGNSFESKLSLKNIPLQNKNFVSANKKDFKKYFKTTYDIDIDMNLMMHGCKEPDEVLIDTTKKKIFIIEKKFQNCGGSVCEKLQTGPAKKKNYARMISRYGLSYNLEYIYVLSNWFKNTCQNEIEYLQDEKIPVYFLEQSESLYNFIVNS